MRGEARRSIAIVNPQDGVDPSLLPGFPLALPGSAEGGPKLVDIDGDGVRDIVIGTSDGRLNVNSLATGSPVAVPGFPYATQPLDGFNPTAPATVPSYVAAPAYRTGASGGIDLAVAREAIAGSPAIADMHKDGRPEIAFVTLSGSVYLIDSTGNDLPGWPQRLPLVPSCPLDPSQPKPPGPCMDENHDLARGAYGSPVLFDLDNDGELDLIVAAFDGNVYAFHASGSALSGWPVSIHSPKGTTFGRILTTPTVADLNGDGVVDVATGSNERLAGDAGLLFAVDGRGTNAPGGPYLKNWPIAVGSPHAFPVDLPMLTDGVTASQAALDLEGKGKTDLLIMRNGSPPIVVSGDPGVQRGGDLPPNVLPVRGPKDSVARGFDPTNEFGDRTSAKPDTMLPLFSQPAVGDLDEDGTPDVILSGGSLSLAQNLASDDRASPFQHLLAFWSGKTGKMLPGSPVILEDYTFLTSEAVADVTGDGYPEVILGNGAYFVHAVDACGREAAGWPKFTDGWIAATPAVGVLVPGSRALDVVESTREGYLYAWATQGTDTGVVQWESFHHDNANTGNYSVKLDQGVTRAGTSVLDCDLPATPSPSPVYAPDGGGGCSCRVGGTRGTGGAGALPLALALLLWRGQTSRRAQRVLSFPRSPSVRARP
jgi:hypothetical protein